MVVEEKVHTFALAFGKQASFRGVRQAGNGAGEAAEQLTRGTKLMLTETPKRKRCKKKLKKNLEVTDFLLTFAKFFRLTKTGGLRATGSGAGKSPRTLKDLQ